MVPVEIRDMWLRGILRMRLQLRPCGDATCSADPAWFGPSGTPITRFDEMCSRDPSPPGFDFHRADCDRNGTPDGLAPLFGPTRYLQYLVEFGTANANETPVLANVRVCP